MAPVSGGGRCISLRCAQRNWPLAHHAYECLRSETVSTSAADSQAVRMDRVTVAHANRLVSAWLGYVQQEVPAALRQPAESQGRRGNHETDSTRCPNTWVTGGRRVIGPFDLNRTGSPRFRHRVHRPC